MFNKRTMLSMSVLAGLMVIGAAIGIFMSRYYQHSQPPERIEGILWPDPKVIGDFSMLNQEGKTFTRNDLSGKWSFLFFGYTNCPDVCPTTLAILNEVSRLINNTNSPIDSQFIFVTVDPMRDTIEKLENYVGHFNSNFIALGGTQEQLDSLASQIGISYLYESAAEDGSYLVSHTSSIFLIDPKARLISILSQPFNPLQIQSRFVEIEDFISNQD
jgi:protein SCO1/2